MEKHLVSVIMPTYNAGQYLSESIPAVLKQTYSSLELLITDDASTDTYTRSLLQDYSREDERVKVIFLDKNQGPAFARNEAIKRAQGQYIAFCDSDDTWFPEKLERQIRFMEEHQCSLCFTSYIICNEQNQQIGIANALPRVTFNMLKRDNKIGCSTAIYDVEKIGEKIYMPDLQKRQDWGFFLTILHKCHMAYGLAEPLVYYRKRTGSVSSNKMGLIKYNIMIYEKVLHYSWLKARICFFLIFMPTYIIKVLQKKRDSKKFIQNKIHDESNKNGF